MRKKSEFTTVERAIQTIDGFQKVYNTLQQQTILRGQSQSTLENYIRQIALISLEFKKLPEDKGQNLSLHPHIHCIVPSAGLTLAGNLKRITKNGKYLYPVLMLSPTFRSILLKKIKAQLKQINQLPKYQSLLDDVWKKPWVVYCKPPFGNAQQIVKYLGQYSHRVAISNHRIKNISGTDVTFFYKDYKDESRVKPTTLSGIEFLKTTPTYNPINIKPT